MLTDDEVVKTLLEIKGEVKTLNFKVDSLSSEMGELKKQSEDRRNAIDTVANALRNEAAYNIKTFQAEIADLRQKHTALESEIKPAKWLLILIAGTIVTTGATKLYGLLASDFNPQQTSTIEQQK